MSRYLKEKTLDEQIDSAIETLKKDNEHIAQVNIGLREFVDSTSVNSKAYNSMKLQMEDYITINKSFISANKADISDFASLKLRVNGAKTINGDDIVKDQNEALKSEEKYREKESEYRKKAIKWVIWEWYYNYLADMAGKCADGERADYNRLQKKLDKYDDIENSTNGLFTTGNQLRAIVRSALDEISKSFKSNVFTGGEYKINWDAKWRTELNEIETTMYNNYRDKVFNEDGSINMEEIKHICKKNADEITSQEYAVLAEAYMNMSDEEINEFVKYLMKDRKDIDRFLDRTNCNCSDYSEWTIDKGIISQILPYCERTYLCNLQCIRMLSDDIEKREEVLSYNKNIAQQMTLLGVLYKQEKFRGELKEKEPDIEISREKEGMLKVSFYEEGLSEYNTEFSIELNFSELSNSNIYIGRTEAGESLNTGAMEDALKDINKTFEDESTINNLMKFVDGEVRNEIKNSIDGQIISRITKQSANVVAKKGVPIATDFALYLLDDYIEGEENKRKSEDLCNSVGGIMETSIYDEYGCYGNKVVYEKSFGLNKDFNRDESLERKLEKAYFVYEGEYTEKYMNLVNEKVGDAISEKLSLDILLNDPMYMYELHEEAKDNMGDLEYKEIFKNTNL